MNKYIKLLAFILIVSFLPLFSEAQITPPSFWKRVGDYLQPIKSTDKIKTTEVCFGDNTCQSTAGFWATTSTDYWKTQNNFFSTTTNDYWASIGGYLTTETDPAFTSESANIPRLNAENSFTTGTTTMVNGYFTGDLQVDGIFYAPVSVTVSGDLDMGSYNIFNAGKIGIGTSTPQADIHIANTSDAVLRMNSQTGTGDNGFEIRSNNGTMYLTSLTNESYFGFGDKDNQFRFGITDTGAIFNSSDNTDTNYLYGDLEMSNGVYLVGDGNSTGGLLLGSGSSDWQYIYNDGNDMRLSTTWGAGNNGFQFFTAEGEGEEFVIADLYPTTGLTVYGSTTATALELTGENTGIKFQDGTYQITAGANYSSYLNFITETSNTKVGYEAGKNNIASLGVFLGHQSGMGSSTASTAGAHSTIAIGFNALNAQTTGSANVAIGVHALNKNTTGKNNVGVGYGALSNKITGDTNTVVGYGAGQVTSTMAQNTSAINGLYLGANTRPLDDGGINEIIIGASAYGNGSNSVTIGNSNITKTILKGSIGIGTTTPATLLDIFSTGTTTMSVDSNSATQGSCLKLKDYDGGGYTYCVVLDGTMSCSTTSCE